MKDLLHADKCSKAIKSISDLKRIKILELLSKNEMCVTDIVKRMNLYQPIISHHLAILKSAGVIIDRRQGRRIFYSLHPSVYKKPSEFVDRIDFGFCSVEFKRRGVEIKKKKEMVEGEL
jgi:ArsR family transcriptional regulator